jgi:hypothetical protein
MDQTVYEEALALLKGAGIEIEKAVYSAEGFGSWHIDCKTTPLSRLIWDGRDRMLQVQTKVVPDGYKLRQWVDQMTATSDVNPTAAMAVEALLEAACG